MSTSAQQLIKLCYNVNMRLIALIFTAFLLTACADQAVENNLLIKQIGFMRLTSPAFENQQAMDSVYTCDGQDINPPLHISDVPTEAKSLALIMDDPDALRPAGKVWDHWIVWNIPVSTTDIPEGQEPRGVHGLGTSDNLDYHGPCPPDGEHRYFFKLYALDVELDLDEGAGKDEVEESMDGHILAYTELIGLYNRKK